MGLNRVSVMSFLLTSSVIQQANNPKPTVWTPLDLAGLIEWFKTNDLANIVESSGLVSQINGQVGNYNLSQATLGDRMTTGTRASNGKNVLDSSSDYMTVDSFNRGESGDIMIALYFEHDSSPLIASGVIAFALNLSVEIPTGAAPSPFSLKSNIFPNTQYTNVINTGANIIVVTINDSAKEVNSWVNGILVTNTPLTLARSIDTLGVLSYGKNRYASGIDGGFGDYVITEDIDTTSRQKTEGYLAHEFGAASVLPINHPYKLSPP